jgi:hypothetical protein
VIFEMLLFESLSPWPRHNLLASVPQTRVICFSKIADVVSEDLRDHIFGMSEVYMRQILKEANSDGPNEPHDG